MTQTIINRICRFVTVKDIDRFFYLAGFVAIVVILGLIASKPPTRHVSQIPRENYEEAKQFCKAKRRLNHAQKMECDGIHVYFEGKK